MKATLCVFVALVAVTSAAPAFMQSNRRGACGATGWCTSSSCDCGTGVACGATDKYCTVGTGSPAPAPVMTSACAVTTGATANSGACSCGSPAVTNPNTAKMVPATTAAGLFCYFSKNLATGADNTQASVGKCAKRASVEGVTSNEVSTCTTFDSLNGCAKDKVCFNTGGKNVCAVAACVKADNSAGTDGSAAVNGDCGCGDNNAFAANGKFCKVVNSFGFVSDTKVCNHEDGTTAVSGPCT